MPKRKVNSRNRKQSNRRQRGGGCGCGKPTITRKQKGGCGTCGPTIARKHKGGCGTCGPTIARKHKGGGIIQAPTCAQQVDVSRYTRPCASGNELPLDNIFMKHFTGGGLFKRRKHKNKSGGLKKKGSKKKARKGNAKSKQQKGSGFSILPDANIGNLAEVRGYSDCCPPVFLKDGATWSNNFQSVCGQSGGKGKRRKSKRRNSKRRNNKKHRGGGSGCVNSNFSADMMTREFGCRQPDWGPNCV